MPRGDSRGWGRGPRTPFPSGLRCGWQPWARLGGVLTRLPISPGQPGAEPSSLLTPRRFSTSAPWAGSTGFFAAVRLLMCWGPSQGPPPPPPGGAHQAGPCLPGSPAGSQHPATLPHLRKGKEAGRPGLALSYGRGHQVTPGRRPTDTCVPARIAHSHGPARPTALRYSS